MPCAQKHKPAVLHLLMSLGLGGAETHVVSLTKNLKHLGWPVLVASYGGERVKELEDSKIPHFQIPLHSRSPMQMYKASKTITQLIDTENVKLVHAHARIPAWISQFICKKKNIPLLTTYHWTFVSGFPWNFFTKQGDYAIAVSKVIEKYVVKEFGFNRDKIKVIPNGIDTRLYSPCDNLYRLASKKIFGLTEEAGPVILYASRLEKDLTKAALTVLESLFTLRHKYPNAVMLVAGDGEGMETVKSKIRSINEKCGRQMAIPLGFVKDTPPMYHAADLVVGMSRVALEAMSSGRPVIVAGPDGIFGPVCPDIIETLEERNFVSREAPSPITPEILSLQIDTILSNSSLVAYLSRFGREIVETHHSIEFMTEKVQQVYEKLLAIKR